MIRRPPRSTPFPYPPLFRSFRDDRDALPFPTIRHMRGPLWAVVMRPPEPAIIGLLVLRRRAIPGRERAFDPIPREDRKSTRLNSSHSQISYAVFCLKKNKQF